MTGSASPEGVGCRRLLDRTLLRSVAILSMLVAIVAENITLASGEYETVLVFAIAAALLSAGCVGGVLIRHWSWWAVVPALVVVAADTVTLIDACNRLF